MVASVNLATAKKDGCAKNGPNTDHTWEIWLHPLTWLPPKKMVARPPMVALLATNKYGCAKTKDLEYNIAFPPQAEKMMLLDASRHMVVSTVSVTIIIPFRLL